MTANTEQERPKREDFEQWSISTNQGYDLTRNQSGRMQTYEHDKTEHAWRGFCHGWIAARRAPVVPQFSHVAKTKLNYLLEAGEAITGYAIENKDGRRGAIDFHGFVYWWQVAAAPLPPDAQRSENLTIKTDAAPVQLPDPVGVAHTDQLDNIKDGYAYIYPVGSVGAGCKLYTEQQVRQLLAKHGIK